MFFSPAGGRKNLKYLKVNPWFFEGNVGNSDDVQHFFFFFNYFLSRCQCWNSWQKLVTDLLCVLWTTDLD